MRVIKIMRPIKLRYIYRTRWGKKKVYTAFKTIDELEGNGFFLGLAHELLSRDQFTGLKDKNGKESYEGDIVRGSWGDTPEIFKIIFNENEACFDGELPDGNPVVFGDYTKGMEVIGNITENPELLEDKHVEEKKKTD